jgi:TolB protein
MTFSAKKIFGFIISFDLIFSGIIFSQAAALGIFDGKKDIGASLKPGSVEYDSTQKTYTVTGGGENMWFSNDAFHFVWKKVSGNVSLAADVHWIDTGGHPHRKACLIVRQSLDAASAYADAALHGDGLTSLQYRENSGDLTHEIQSNVKGPFRLRIEKRGEYVFMSIAHGNGTLESAGGSVRIKFTDPFYIGLGICAHDSGAAEKAVFSNVEIKIRESKVTGDVMLESTLETIAIESADRKVIYKTGNHIEAPNWSRDGKYFIFNSGGSIYKLPMNNWIPQLIDTKFATHCNNDHGISPNGKLLAISDQTVENKSFIYILPVDGGEPRLITPLGPSYWHGWSPDGKTLAYCG